MERKRLDDVEARRSGRRVASQRGSDKAILLRRGVKTRVCSRAVVIVRLEDLPSIGFFSAKEIQKVGDDDTGSGSNRPDGFISPTGGLNRTKSWSGRRLELGHRTNYETALGVISSSFRFSDWTTFTVDMIRGMIPIFQLSNMHEKYLSISDILPGTISCANFNFPIISWIDSIAAYRMHLMVDAIYVCNYIL